MPEWQKSVPVTYFCSPRGARAPNPALITAQSPCRRSRAAQIRLGGPYRNWLHYFSRSCTAAHSAWRLLIWDKWPGSPSNLLTRVSHACLPVQQQHYSIKPSQNKCTLFVKGNTHGEGRQTESDRLEQEVTFRQNVLSFAPLLRCWK